MIEIFKRIEKLTSDIGRYSIKYNEHRCSTTYDTKTKESYPTSAIDYYGLDNEDLIDNCDVDWNGNIYNFHWYDRTQVGFYSLYSNTFDGLIKKIEDLLNEMEIKVNEVLCAFLE